jgi:hypothetical protein
MEGNLPKYFGDPARPSAILIKADESVSGIEFFSPSDFSQQIGLMTRPAGYKVPAHIHNLVERKIEHTQEVLMIRRGSCEVILFNELNTVSHNLVLEVGDVILLAHGGHEINMITECEILEVKQGPYAGNMDKTALFK